MDKSDIKQLLKIQMSKRILALYKTYLIVQFCVLFSVKYL